MFPHSSPQKRKLSEYRDPDYPSTNEKQELQHNFSDQTCKRHCDDNTTAQAIYSDKDADHDDGDLVKNIGADGASSKDRVQRICDVISREFQREITLKHQQLQLIDERLVQARQLLDRLRYAIVSEYYRKQELTLSNADANAVRGNLTLFDQEHMGPQMSIHPSVKKIIGKRPQNYTDIFRPCPERAAAQNAKNTIRARSQANRKQKRRLQQLIREQGIVIDHSKDGETGAAGSSMMDLLNANVTRLAASQAYSNVKTSSSGDSKQQPPKQHEIKPTSNANIGTALNVTRLNNKTKHLVVVGNTSKYIGAEDSQAEHNPHASQKLSHKWLVYVQSKDPNLPLECFIKKIRFFLHPSYRPNDIVDVCAPPFQIARRGWGEFPMRIQLFFHGSLQQKPIQLVHNVVLDKTLCGLHTLGGETLLEIWLRSERLQNTPSAQSCISSSSSNINDAVMSSTSNQTSSVQQSPKAMTSRLRTTSITPIKSELDDNLLEFLNKIEETPTSICADIEKIQPTVMVTEPLPNITVSTSKMAAQQQQQTTLCIGAPAKANKIHFIEATTGMSTAIASNAISYVNNNITTFAKETSSFTLTTASTALPSEQIVSSTTTNHTPTIANTIYRQSEVNMLQLNNNNIINNNNNNNCKRILRIVKKTSNDTSTTTTNATRKFILKKCTAREQQQLIQPKSIVQSSVNTTIIATPKQPLSPPPLVAITNATSVPKRIMQRKLVKLVDAKGNIKYLQMLVAVSSASTSNTTSRAITTFNSPFPLTIASSTNMARAMRVPTSATPALMKLSRIPANRDVEQQRVNAAGIQLLSSNGRIMDATQVNTSVPSIPTKPTGVTNHTSATVTTSATNSTINNTITKNVVFQKEGKVYIIDPLQMKLKQGQQNQVSLLKPQVSMLRQQQQQQQQHQQHKLSMVQSVVSDHDYVSGHTRTKPVPSPSATTNSAHHVTPPQPQVHLGIRQTRAKASSVYETFKQERKQFEESFLATTFATMRSAIEYLLRRLPMIAAKNTLAAAFPFVYNTQNEFHALAVLKQRACEWLRAKYVARILRKHDQLQQLSESSSGKDAFWTTREIVLFARYHAYTPALKLIEYGVDNTVAGDGDGQPPFTQLVKNELKMEQPAQYETLTLATRIIAWTDEMLKRLQAYESVMFDTQIIDINSIDDLCVDTAAKIKRNVAANPLQTPTTSQMMNGVITISPPAHLQNEIQLATDICKDIGIHLEAYEPIDDQHSNIVYPKVQTVLAQSIHHFIERLLRQAISFKLQQTTMLTTASTTVLSINDIRKAIVQCREFDFLTNAYMGKYQQQQQQQHENNDHDNDATNIR